MTNHRAALAVARLFLLISIVVNAHAFALDLKGVELGKVAPRTQLTESLGLNFGESHCRMRKDMPPDERRAGSYRCDGAVEVEGMHFAVTVTFTEADAVEQIEGYFGLWDFDHLAAAAARKWGKPQITHATLQNGFGARYEETVYTWKLADGVVTLYSRDPNDVGHGLLQLKAHGDAPDPSKSRL
jgi:hypothetical protein